MGRKREPMIQRNRSGARYVVMAAAWALFSTTLSFRAGAESGGAVGAACGCESGQCQCEICGNEHCVLVPETKTTKKWVYATKLVPYCLLKCRNPFHGRDEGCDSCPGCESCVRYKRVLVKREVVTTKQIYKCVPACEACRARAHVPGSSPIPPTKKDAVAQPGEPQPLPASPGPAPAE